MSKRTTVALDFSKGQYAAGDAGSIPDGYARELLNCLPRPNRLPARPPFVYDAVMAVNGLLNFDDNTNKASRLVSIDTSQNLRIKATSGETWSGVTTGTVGTRVTSFANFRGKVYYMLDDGNGVPSKACSFDGTTINAAPFTSSIAARAVVALGNRLFFIYPRVTVAPEQPGVGGSTVFDVMYGFASAQWSKTNIDARAIAISTGTYIRLYPKSTTASSMTFVGGGGLFAYSVIGVPASSSVSTYLLRWDMRGIDPTYRMPFTIDVFVDTTWVDTVPYAVGDTVSDGTHMQRVVTAGTSGAAPPAWAATTGSTTADGTVTWINEGTNVVASTTGYVPNATEAADFTTFYVPIAVPPSHGSGFLTFNSLNVRLNLFSAASPTIQLAPIDVAFKDGIADGDPRKANRGLQLTRGDYYFNFLNTETATSQAQDTASVMWSENGAPSKVVAVNTYNMVESVGYPTAGASISNRLLAFKRNSFSVFQITTDPYVPIRREIINDAVGCLGPLAVAAMEDECYFIGENDIYKYSVGDAPSPICGDAMREAIMGRTASWVESQTTYRRPLLSIDRYRLVIWVYTQRGKLYSYDLRNQQWGAHQVGSGIEVDTLLFNSNTNEMYVSFGGHGLARIDYSSTSEDSIDNTGTTYPGTVRIVFRPVELYQPPRFDATLDDIRCFHSATVSRSGQTLTASFSFDQGSTYPRSIPFTNLPLSSAGEMVPLTIPAFQTAPSITVKLEHTGKLGESAWCLSPRFSANINVRRGEYVQTLPTPGSGNL